MSRYKIIVILENIGLKSKWVNIYLRRVVRNLRAFLGGDCADV